MFMNTGKISLGKLLSLLVFVVGFQSVWADVWDGVTRTRPDTATIDGKTYFLIESAANLVWFSDSVNVTTNGNVGINAKVVAEYIDLDHHPFTPIAAGKGDTKYTGIFDGNGVTIANLYIDSTSLGEIQCAYEQNVGFFGTQGGGSIIKDVILENVYLSANADRGFACGAGADYQISVGPVVGWQSGGTVSGCYASGMIYSKGKGQGVGGIVGTSSGKIMDCLSIVSVNASGEDGYVGGILGYAENSTVESSVYDGNSLVNTDNKMVGGIVGKIRNGKNLVIDRCYYDSDVATSGGVAEGTPTGSTPVGDDDVNTQEYACVLNDGIWNGSSCGDSTGVWMNGGNITNNGVSKNADGETVFLIQFSANGGSFAQRAKTTKILKFMSPLTADEISEPTHDSLKVFLGWSKDSAATKADASLGVVYGKKTIYAVWRDQISYTVTFDHNTGEGAKTVSKVVVENEAITTDGIASEDLPSIYTVGENRYYFTGWSASKTGSVLDDFGAATKDVTFYAQWSLTPKHTVSFNMNGHGSAVASMVVLEGDAVSAPSPSPVAAGYVFGGWYVEQSCITPFNFKTPITENQILYAKWTPEVYSIIYNLDGGINDSKNPSTYTIETATILLADPTRVGYVFGGWFYDGAFTNPASQITEGSTGDKTLYAKWSLKTYSVVYNAGQIGQGNGLEAKKVHGVDLTLLGTFYTANGYVQDGWAIENEGSKVYDLGATYSVDAPVILYPHWVKAVYTITYELNGGVNHGDNVASYTLDDSTGITLKNPTRVGYTFDGWYAMEDFSGSKISKLSVKSPYGDKVLYAKWKQITATVNVEDNSCEYNGKSCGAKVTVSGLPSGYKTVAVTDSIKNVKDGPIDAKIVGFAIVNTATGDTVTSAFNVVFKESGSVSVNPKLVNFTTDNIPPETYTGDSIHVKGGSKTSGLIAGHSHNVGYTVDALEWREDGYDPVMTDPAKVKILDADGNDVTDNYTIGSIAPPTKKFVVKKSDGDFDVVFADEHVTDDGNSLSMTRGAYSDVPGTTFKYQLDGAGEWTDDLSSLVASGVGEHTVKVIATNPNYNKTQEKTAKLVITDKIIVTVEVKSKSKEYDGTPLTTTYETNGAFEPGDEPVVELSGSIKDVGSVIARVKSFKVMNGSTDVTSKYVVNTYDAFLTVKKTVLNIKTESGTKSYDGTPLVKDVPTVTGFKNNETATIEVTGSQKMVGSSTNEYTIVWGGSANYKNYQIVEDLGTLTVTKAQVKIRMKDAVKLYGDADPALIGTVSGLADGAEGDLGELRYYRLNPSVKNAGENVDSIAVSYTPNPNYDVTVVLGKLTIEKRHVTLTSASATKVYDGTPLTNDAINVGGDGFAPDEGFIFTVTGTQTNAGSSENAFTYVLKANTDTAANYIVDAPVIGKLQVTKSPVNVTIKGNTNTYAYNGWEQVISGYSLKMDNSLYSVSDIEFSGDSVVRKTRSGNYPMGLEVKNFANKNANFDVTFDVTDGRLVILPPEIAVKYNDAGDTIHVVVGEKDSDSEVNAKINDALENHVPPIDLPTKDEDEDSTYAFAGWAKNLGSGMYEPVFDATVKLDTVQVVYQKNPKETIDVVIHVTDTYSEIVQRIDSTFNDRGLDLPTKPSDGDSNYVLVWVKDDSTGEYKPEFKGELIVVEIVVQYGDNPTDTIHVKIRPKDTHTQITDKIGSALTNHLPPIKVTPKDTSYSLVGWKQDSKTGNYVPIFSKDELVFKINFHLPEGAELTEEFEGYVYGKVAKLPDAVMTSDTTWVFKGWYTKTKGRGNHVKAMREGDFGNKSLYPYFIKTLRYDTYGEKEVNANGEKGEIVVIYTDRADTTIERALRSVLPKDFAKNGVKYTFNGWKLVDGVYVAIFKRVSVRFNVVLDSRAFSIEEAQMGARYAVFDMDGRVVKRGVVSNGSQRVEVPKSGSYTVRVGKESVQVNVK